MKRNSKIFIGLSIFLFCLGLSFNFTFGNGGVTAEFVWADMIPFMMALLTAALAMIVLNKKAKREELYDGDELELRELNKSDAQEYDSDEFV